MTIVPVILAGGIGELLASEQIIDAKADVWLVGNRTMAEETLSRVHSLCSCDSLPLIITSKAIAGKLKRPSHRDSSTI